MMGGGIFRIFQGKTEYRRKTEKRMRDYRACMVISIMLMCLLIIIYSIF